MFSATTSASSYLLAMHQIKIKYPCSIPFPCVTINYKSVAR